MFGLVRRSAGGWIHAEDGVIGGLGLWLGPGALSERKRCRRSSRLEWWTRCPPSLERTPRKRRGMPRRRDELVCDVCAMVRRVRHRLRHAARPTPAPPGPTKQPVRLSERNTAANQSRRSRTRTCQSTPASAPREATPPSHFRTTPPPFSPRAAAR
eukprot:346493-Chlamydomonas_euryale.AAC.1